MMMPVQLFYSGGSWLVVIVLPMLAHRRRVRLSLVPCSGHDDACTSLLLWWFLVSSDYIAHASSQETCEVVLGGLVINNDFSPLCTGEIMSQSRATSKTVPWNSAKDSFMCHKLEDPPCRNSPGDCMFKVLSEIGW